MPKDKRDNLGIKGRVFRLFLYLIFGNGVYLEKKCKNKKLDCQKKLSKKKVGQICLVNFNRLWKMTKIYMIVKM